MDAIHHIFSFVCHQEPARSFAFQGAALPFCHRCAGVYMGIFVMVLFFALHGKGQLGLLPRRLFYLNLAFFPLMGLTGFHLVNVNVSARFLLGTLLGGALVSVIWPIFAAKVLGLSCREWRARDKAGYAAALLGPSALLLLTWWNAAAGFYVFLTATCAGLLLGFFLPNAVLVWCLGRRIPVLSWPPVLLAAACVFIVLEFWGLGILRSTPSFFYLRLCHALPA